MMYFWLSALQIPLENRLKYKYCLFLVVLFWCKDRSTFWEGKALSSLGEETAMKAKFWKGRVYLPYSTFLACPMMLTRVGMSACLITLVWARWKYKVGLHQIWYEDYAQLTIPDTKNEDDKNAQEDSHRKGRILWRRKKILCDAAVPEWAAAPLICTGTGVGVGKSCLFTGPILFYHFFTNM